MSCLQKYTGVDVAPCAIPWHLNIYIMPALSKSNRLSVLNHISSQQSAVRVLRSSGTADTNLHKEKSNDLYLSC